MLTAIKPAPSMVLVIFPPLDFDCSSAAAALISSACVFILTEKFFKPLFKLAQSAALVALFLVFCYTVNKILKLDFENRV